MLILERDQSLLRYKKQKNEDSNIENPSSDLRSNQTKNPKKKKKTKWISLSSKSPPQLSDRDQLRKQKKENLTLHLVAEKTKEKIPHFFST